MTKWFDWKEFFSTHQEWHAWVIGWGDGASFRSTDWTMLNTYYGDTEKMRQELHYYKAGLPIGLFSVLGFITGMIVLIVRLVM